MKLNNRGFAIASTLYTIFILFLMILLGILASLTARERMLDKSTETFASDYTTDKLDQSVVLNVFNSVVPVSGKYVFSMAGLDSYCYSYLASGSTISNFNSLEYTTSECNNLKASTSQIDYVGVYKFYK